MDLAKMDLAALQALDEDIRGKLDHKIKERNKITLELNQADGMFSEANRAKRQAEADDLKDKCRGLSTTQHNLNIEIRDLWAKLLPIYTAIFNLKNPLT